MDRLLHCDTVLTVSALLLCGAAAEAHYHEHATTPERSLDLRRLMSPTAAERGAEQSGRVHIYDSLDINAVNAALDQHFDRIQNMMFIRIRHLPPTGAGPADVEEDGCD